MNAILVDARFLIAVNSFMDRNHAAATQFLKENTVRLLLPEVVLTEAAFLLGRAGGLTASLRFLDRLPSTKAILQSVAFDDLRRAREIMAEYGDAKLDFVDCCLMALSERLNITQLCTYDHRDFSMFRPRHCDALELLPHREQ